MTAPHRRTPRETVYFQTRHHLAAGITVFSFRRPLGRRPPRRGHCHRATVAIDVMINHWNNRFYNALQDRDWDAFVSELLFFCILVAAFILLAVYQLYLNQWLQSAGGAG